MISQHINVPLALLKHQFIEMGNVLDVLKVLVIVILHMNAFLHAYQTNISIKTQINANVQLMNLTLTENIALTVMDKNILIQLLKIVNIATLV